MEIPLVTVFIPLYNAEQYIKDALESIINQTYRNIEILIVDDGSTDKSIEIVRKFNDKRIRVLENKYNKGIPYTRNVGLQNAKGDYIALMDSDDIAKVKRIEKQVNFMERNKDVDAVSSYVKLFGGKFSRVSKSPFLKSVELKPSLLFYNRIINPAAFIRMKSIKNYGLRYNESYFIAQDYDFWAQLSKVGKFNILPKVLLKYRVGHENITKRSKENKSSKRKKVIDSIRNDLLDFYGFELNQSEKKLYNSFFSEDQSFSYESFKSSESLSLMKKIINQNKKINAFNDEIFKRVLSLSISTSLVNQTNKPSVIWTKVTFYRKICKEIEVNPKIKDIYYIVLKGVVSKLF